MVWSGGWSTAGVQWDCDNERGRKWQRRRKGKRTIFGWGTATTFHFPQKGGKSKKQPISEDTFHGKKIVPWHREGTRASACSSHQQIQPPSIKCCHQHGRPPLPLLPPPPSPLWRTMSTHWGHDCSTNRNSTTTPKLW